jgi:hypothetical protein
MSRGALSDPSVIGSKKTSDEKRGTPKTQGFREKISDEKRCTTKIQGARKKDNR